MTPLCVDLYCGLGGWSEGFLSEGYECIGYDIEAHDYGTGGYPGELRIRDVRSIHGSELKDATCIVGSSPCQELSYRAMPWKRAKALPPPYLGMELFNAQFRIQREACEAAGHYIPMVVENVRGAQKWVGRANAHFGSFYLWGDVGMVGNRVVCVVEGKLLGSHGVCAIKGAKVPGFRFDGESHGSFQSVAVKVASENGRRTDLGKGARFTTRDCSVEARQADGVKVGGSGAAWWREPLQAKRREATAIKNGGDWFGSGENCSEQRKHGSKSSSRKAASALIAKIPYSLSQYIARTFKQVHDDR